MAAKEAEMWVDMELSAVVIHASKRLHFIMVGGSRECKVGCNLEGEPEGLDWKKKWLVPGKSAVCAIM